MLERLEERHLLSGWLGFGHDAQHTGLSDNASQNLEVIHWQAAVDQNPPAVLAIHYGSPVITPANTVVVPVKTADPVGRFQVEGHDGSDGRVKWVAPSDYRLPPHDWTPAFSPTLTADGELYFPGAGGTVYQGIRPDADRPLLTQRLAFYGIDQYDPTYDDTVFIDTPLTADAAGDIFFGFQVTGPTPLNLESGIARLGPDGQGTWVAARTVVGEAGSFKVVHNAAPALSPDGHTVYVALTDADGTGSGRGWLAALDSTTLARITSVALQDVQFPENSAVISEDGSASPTVGPDGDVYLGVRENPSGSNHGRGWLLHFDATLSQARLPGAFGWDETVAVVPSALIPSYQGPSNYLLLSKYNDYPEFGGADQNEMAILDPNQMEIDPVTGACVMNEVETILGPTPDPDFSCGVREWCPNASAVDPIRGSVLVNNEDGRLYRWDLASNTFSDVVTLTDGLGEAYTPTAIGADGTVYAIHNATLYAVGASDGGGGAPRMMPRTSLVPDDAYLIEFLSGANRLGRVNREPQLTDPPGTPRIIPIP
jgi:hypothetical protein